jgi:hypothetical protein
MSDKVSLPIFAASRMWAGAAHVQRMPLDVPDGPHKGEKANVLSTRERSGKTVVEVTWKVDGQVNLDSQI